MPVPAPTVLRSTRRAEVFSLVIVALSASGCMSFRQGPSPHDLAWPPAAPSTKRIVSVAVRRAAIIDGRHVDPSDRIIQNWRSWILSAYRDSGLFADLRPSSEIADLNVEVRLTNSGKNPKALAYLSGLTLTLLPVVARDEFAMKTTVRDRQGHLLAEVERADIITTWFQLFLIFGTPVASPVSVGRETISDLTRASIVELCGRGVFEEASPSLVDSSAVSR